MHEVDDQVVGVLARLVGVHFVDDVCREHGQREDRDHAQAGCQVSQGLVLHRREHNRLAPGQRADLRMHLLLLSILEFENQNPDTQEEVERHADEPGGKNLFLIAFQHSFFVLL